MSLEYTPSPRVLCHHKPRLETQIGVGVGNAGKVFIELGLPLAHRCVQHLEQPREPAATVGAVFAGPGLQQFKEDVPWLEDAGAIGEQAEPRTPRFDVPLCKRIVYCGNIQIVVDFAQIVGFNGTRATRGKASTSTVSAKPKRSKCSSTNRF